MTKTSLLLATLLTAATFSSQAAELYAPDSVPASSTLTRAQVRQSVLEARKAGELNHNDVDLPGVENEPFARTRESVRAETLAARANGGLEHDDVDLPSVAKGSVLNRQDVRADAVASRRLVRTSPGRNTIDY